MITYVYPIWLLLRNDFKIVRKPHSDHQRDSGHGWIGIILERNHH